MANSVDRILPEPLDPSFILRHSDPFDIWIEAIESYLNSTGTPESGVPVALQAIGLLQSGRNRLAVEALATPQAGQIPALYFHQLIVIGYARLGRIAEAKEALHSAVVLGGEDFGYNCPN